MKRTILITAFLLFAGTILQAQILPKPGIKGGLNYAAFNNSDNTEYKAGIIGGVYARLKIPATPIHIQPEILYAQYGSNFEGTDWKMSIDYVQVPVLSQFGFGAPGLPVRPSVYFGHYAGFKVNSSVEGPAISVKPDEFFESTDAGVVVGAGLNISRINIDFRYTAGLTPVIADPTFEDGEKNGAFALTLGIDL